MAYYNSTQVQPQVQQYNSGPVIYQSAPPITYQSVGTKNYGHHYDRTTSTGLGATLIVLACLSIAAGGMAIAYEAAYWYVGMGIWAGASYLASGAVSVAAGQEATNKLIKATLVCSVFDILLGISQIVVASLGVQHDKYQRPEEAIASHALMIAVGASVIIFGIWLLVISARAVSVGSKAQIATIPVAFAPNIPDPVFIYNGPPPSSTSQSQPPPYYVQTQQHPSTSNQQQMIYIGVQQVSPMNTS